uniref:lipoate--protein ligase n=1 Tax=Mastigamoeba balamuthi TaxID=108607 RepID=A0A0B4R3B1_MASBA|nr:lipoate-protein ligase a [Mastigamoeba balamuthi]|eukprot:m51a1_g12360 putative lipoate-protein ligase a (355) ;mRNA; f:569509-571189
MALSLPRAPLFASGATTNPFANLAVEEWLLRAHAARALRSERPSLYVWRNSPCVVIGAHQNAYAECAIGAMAKDDVTLVRRHTGGGAVYHDLGNTNWTFVGAKRNFSRERNFGVVVRALRGLGVDGATVTGRNDITTGDGRKVSGSAFRETGAASLHHGTVLVNADLTALQRYLTPNPLKLASKGVASARARVANLAEINKKARHEELCDALTAEFRKEYGIDASVKVLSLDAVDFCRRVPEASAFYDQLNTMEWTLGQNPPFATRFETRFSWGIVDLRMDVKNGVIENVVAFSDTLVPEFVDELCSTLKGVGFTGRAINGALRLKAAGCLNADATSQLLELMDWLCPQIPDSN